MTSESGFNSSKHDAARASSHRTPGGVGSVGKESQGAAAAVTAAMRPLSLAQFERAVEFQLPEPLQIFGSRAGQNVRGAGNSASECSSVPNPVPVPSSNPNPAPNSALDPAPDPAPSSNPNPAPSSEPSSEPEVWAVPLAMPGQGAMSFVYCVVLIGAAHASDSSPDSGTGGGSAEFTVDMPKNGENLTGQQEILTRPAERSSAHSAEQSSTQRSGRRQVTVIDPGWPDRRDLETSTFGPLEAFLNSRGCTLEDIHMVIGTHAHPDHMGGVGPLAERARAKIAVGAQEMQVMDKARAAERGTGQDTARAAERGAERGTGQDSGQDTARAAHTSKPSKPSNTQSTRWVVDPDNVGAPEGALEPMLEEQNKVLDHWYLPRRTPDALLNSGDLLADHGIAVDFDFEVVPTPGHSPGHISLADRTRGILIAADMIMPLIFPGIGLGIAELDGNPIEDYLDSLLRLEQFDDFHVIPGHGYCFTGLRARRSETLEHILIRAREVRAVLDGEPGASIWDIASQLTWSLGWDGLLQSRMLVSSLRQTMMYRDLVERRPLSDWPSIPVHSSSPVR